jgi:hypothetical protein
MLPIVADSAGDAGVVIAPLSNLITAIQTAMTWIFSLFTKVINTIASNDLLLYPVIVALVMAAVFLVIRIVRSFGLKSRRG